MDREGWATVRPTRALTAGLVFALLAALFIAGPISVLDLLHGRGVSTGASTAQFVVGGIVLAGLFALAYYLRPTRAYGPALAARAVAGVVYLVLLAPYMTAQLTVSTGLNGAVGASVLFLWLAASPVVGLIAAILVTRSDLVDPTVRLSREFPFRPSPPQAT